MAVSEFWVILSGLGWYNSNHYTFKILKSHYSSIHSSLVNFARLIKQVVNLVVQQNKRINSQTGHLQALSKAKPSLPFQENFITNIKKPGVHSGNKQDVFLHWLVARLSPLLHAHINVLGHYSFILDQRISQGQLRPLNQIHLNLLPGLA